MGSYNVLLIGSGGREDAIAWKLSKSERLEQLYTAPGNPGTSRFGTNVTLNTESATDVITFVEEKSIDLVVIGPEKPLVDGMADRLEEEGIPVFGPRREAAMLEGSKEFAKQFMDQYNIPTAAYRSFQGGELSEVMAWIREQDRYPVVLKADGLAAGKGVFICEDAEEAQKRLNQMREEPALKAASGTVVVEEFLHGEELSVFVISDGYTARYLHNAQDHKRVGEGDIGLNTGGMGAYCPAPLMTPELLERIDREIVVPTVTGMQLNDTPYKGVIYLGLMITADGPKVIEYNCRFGDPECQVILPALENDLLELMLAVNEQRLDEKEIRIDNRYRCCVVLASGGYPEAYEKGKEITGIDEVDSEALVFQAGTATENGTLVTSGGRVLNVVGSGDTLQHAISHVYQNVEKIGFENAYYRRDIGAKGLRRLS
ncbi:MAG: phosphoribosylamine--glycine ligase [Balneolaceae bacterium]